MSRRTAERRARSSGAARRSRAPAFVALAGLAVVAALGVAYLALRPDESAPLAAPVHPRYPDLTMGALEEITVGIRPDGTLSVRFPATIVNIGDAEFLVRAARDSPLVEDWRVVQRIPDADDLFSNRDTGANLVWGGDGHDHWHVREVEAHRIETMDGEILGEVVKAGFCFFDTDHVRPDIPGSPETHAHSARGCGGRIDMGVHMGLSVGWGDTYPSQMLDQTISVPELPDGRYVVRMIADPSDWFAETDEANNEVATEIEVGTGADGVRTVEVIGDAG